MIRVYISSTYRDLLPEREAAAEAVSLLLGHPVRMEHYVASDQRPLDRCLADVRGSDIYVGLVAWRYGFRPRGQAKSITRLEYEAARDSGLPCLLFLHSEERKSGWPQQYVDTGADGTDLLAFRQEVGERHTVSFFADTPDLRVRVNTAVSLELLDNARAGQLEVPPLLPYLADRSRQCEQLADAVDKHLSTAPQRPLVMVVHGDEREAHAAFLERLEKHTLPRLFGAPGAPALVHRVDPAWGSPEGGLEERKRRLRRLLAEKVTGVGRASQEEVARQLAAHRCPVMVASSVSSESWRNDEPALIAEWLAMWQGWPDAAMGHIPIPILSIRYQDVEHLGWIDRWGGRRSNARVEDFMKTLDLEGRAGLTGVKLDRLESVQEGHVMNWIEGEAAEFIRQTDGAGCDPLVLSERLRPRVQELFRGARKRAGTDGIAMESLAVALRAELQRCLAAGAN